MIDPAPGLDGGGLDEHQACAAHGEPGQIGEVPVVGDAIDGAIFAAWAR